MIPRQTDEEKLPGLQNLPRKSYGGEYGETVTKHIGSDCRFNAVTVIPGGSIAGVALIFDTSEKKKGRADTIETAAGIAAEAARFFI